MSSFSWLSPLFTLPPTPWGHFFYPPLMVILSTLGLFFFFFRFYWSISNLRGCDNFCCAASDPVIHTHISILSQNVFPRRSSQGAGWSSLCYTSGPCWPVTPYTSVRKPPVPPPDARPVPFGNHKFFKACESVSIPQKSSFVSFFFFQIPHTGDIICLSFT